MAKRLTEFQRVQRQWYAKLKKYGFKDAEDHKGRLKESASRVQRKNEYENLLDSWPDKIAYYDMCTTFLNEYKFDTKREEIIWEYHTNGISHYNIVKLLKKVKIYTYRRLVDETVNRLEELMKKRYIK